MCPSMGWMCVVGSEQQYYVGSVGTFVLLVISALTGTKFTHLEAGPAVPPNRRCTNTKDDGQLNNSRLVLLTWIFCNILKCAATGNVTNSAGWGRGAGVCGLLRLTFHVPERTKRAHKKLGHFALGN